MKPIYILLALLLSAGAVSGQTIRVRSTDNLQTLINNATAGTTFIVESGSYGTINVNKKVTLIGTGYFLGTGGQATNVSAEISILTFQAGGEFSSVTGFVINGCSVQTSTILISRNAIGSLSISKNGGNDPILGIILKQNYASGGVSIQRTGFTATNNIFLSLSTDSNCSGEVKNNVIYGTNGAGGYGFVNLGQLTIKNNIIRGLYNGPNLNSIEYNYCYYFNPGNLSGTNRFNSADPPANLFTGFPTNAANLNLDARFQLPANSPAKGAGEGGIDCGAFGGDEPYVLSGLPAGPIVYELTVPSQAPSASTLNVRVKARVQN